MWTHTHDSVITTKAQGKLSQEQFRLTMAELLPLSGVVQEWHPATGPRGPVLGAGGGPQGGGPDLCWTRGLALGCTLGRTATGPYRHLPGQPYRYGVILGPHNHLMMYLVMWKGSCRQRLVGCEAR